MSDRQIDIPSYEEVARNGIPPELISQLRQEAHALRAAAIAEAFRTLRGVLARPFRRRALASAAGPCL